MILGLGMDLIEVARVAASLGRHGDRFLTRILRPEEIAYCRSCPAPAPPVAARFAAKEAVAKAFGTGIGAQLGWLDIEIGRRADGAPFVILHGAGAALLAARGGRAVHVSLTHTRGHAAAVAVIEG
jgi:holo-[acyl-carrier protein] synthase